MDLLRTHNFGTIQKLLHEASMRQTVHADNIANVDTPHFKRSYVPFATQLAEARQQLNGTRTDVRHLPIGRDRVLPQDDQPQIILDDQTAVNINQNNVDIDREMSLMAQNQLHYNVLIKQITQEIKHLRLAMEVK